MAIYRSVQMTFWTDAKVVDNFTPEDRYFYLYLLTNPHTNLCGCYEISFKQISDETGYTKEVVERLLERMENVHNVIRYSRITKELLMINWGKFNWTKSNDFQKCLKKEIASVKCQEFQDYLFDLADGVKTVPRPSLDGVGTTVTVTDTVNNKNNTESKDNNTVSLTDSDKKEKKPMRFIKPTINEIKDYCKERNNKIDPEAFYSYYESNGWMVGKNKMKNWKMAMVTWEKHQPMYAPRFNRKQISEEDARINAEQRQEYRDYNEQLKKLLNGV